MALLQEGGPLRHSLQATGQTLSDMLNRRSLRPFSL